MKNSICLLALIASTVLACNNADTKKEETTKDKQTVSTESDLDCYAKEDRDTIMLSIRNFTDSVSGTLQYHLFQKDRNNGSVFGKFHGDTLFLEYVFQSEGMDSRREIAFLKKDNSLIQGFGPTAEEGNRQYFTDKSQIRYESGIELKKFACK
jgi:hypothetical protein